MNAEPVCKRRAENPLLSSGVKWLSQCVVLLLQGEQLLSSQGRFSPAVLFPPKANNPCCATKFSIMATSRDGGEGRMDGKAFSGVGLSRAQQTQGGGKGGGGGKPFRLAVADESGKGGISSFPFLTLFSRGREGGKK